MSFNPPKLHLNEYDLLFSYGFAFTHYISNQKNKPNAITGVTAHRKPEQIMAAMQKTKYHHANSALLYHELLKLGVKNVFYVPNGVDLELFHPITPIFHNHNHLIVGHVGKKSPNKNQASFIEPMIKEANCEYKPHYNDYSNALPHEQMVNIYQEFDIGIVASSEEGTPCSTLEAAACGRACIINKIGNAPELIKNGYNGFCIDMDKNEYLKHIDYCVKNPNLVIEMGKNAREEIQKWSWELMSKNYLLMFDKILNIKRDENVYENPALYHIKGYREQWL
jgi:glycosyltransferase involved in cell wall biosynthesis